MFTWKVFISNLEEFAETGTLPQSIQIIERLGQENQDVMLSWLGIKHKISKVEMHRYWRSVSGDKKLNHLGDIITKNRGSSGFYVIRVATLLSADASGWTTIDVLRKFPGDAIEVDLVKLFQNRDLIFEPQATGR